MTFLRFRLASIPARRRRSRKSKPAREVGDGAEFPDFGGNLRERDGAERFPKPGRDPMKMAKRGLSP